MEKLNIFKEAFESHGEIFCGGIDGSHWGVEDWYERTEESIKTAIEECCGDDFEADWSTPWLGCKKEIVSWKISWSWRRGTYLCEVSCSDDFDTEGSGAEFVPHIEIEEGLIDKLKDGLRKALIEADENKKENECFVGFTILDGNSWIDTYIARNPGHEWSGEMDEPGGGCYHQWGIQGEAAGGVISEEEKKAIEEKVNDFLWGEGESDFRVGKFQIKKWED